MSWPVQLSRALVKFAQTLKWEDTNDVHIFLLEIDTVNKIVTNDVGTANRHINQSKTNPQKIRDKSKIHNKHNIIEVVESEVNDQIKTEGW